jgi:hypothetical protein
MNVLINKKLLSLMNESEHCKKCKLLLLNRKSEKIS